MTIIEDQYQIVFDALIAQIEILSASINDHKVQIKFLRKVIDSDNKHINSLIDEVTHLRDCLETRNKHIKTL